jgi:hypothetical protein
VIRARFVALALLAACVPRAPELTPLERAGVHASLTAWREVGLPEPDQAERCDFSRIFIRWARLEDACLPGASSDVNTACLRWEYSGNWFRARQYPVIVLKLGYVLPADSQPIIHECMHALTHCSGLSWWRIDNTRHLDPRIWAAAEKTPGSSAESRARAMVLARPSAD